MALNPRLAGAGALVLAGALGAVLVGQLPAFGRTDASIVATPASPRQALVCPGPAVAVGAAGTGAAEVTASGSPSRVTGTADGKKVVSKALQRGGVGGGGAAPRSLTAAAADSAGPLAGAQLEQTTGDAVGLAATGCTAPATDLWFAAGATTTGRTSVLLLANPSSADARVAVEVWTENGRVRQSAGAQIALPAGDRRAVSLAGIVPSAGGTVVRVLSNGARVGAALEQRTVRGLESGGVDVVGPTAKPAGEQTVTGVRIADGELVAQVRQEEDYGDLQTVVRVLLPGRVAADVAISIRSAAGGQPIVLGRRVAAGLVTDFAVPDLPDGTYSVQVTSAQPVVAGVRTAVVTNASGSTTPTDSGSTSSGSASAAPGSDAGLVGGDGPVDDSSSSGSASGTATSTARGIDLAWFAAGEPMSATAALAVVDAPSPVLTVANPTRTARTVRLSGPTALSLQVPAGGVVAAPVATGLLVLRGTAGLTAGVSYAGDDAVAGYPVRALDQEARSVRITR